MLEDLTTKANRAKNLSTAIKTGEKNKIFDGTLSEKSLNLKSETREENCMRDEMPKLKTFQPR